MYVTDVFRLGLIKESPYERFHDKKGGKSNRPHLTESQIKRLIRMQDENQDIVMNKYIEFFLFQIFTGIAYCDAKSFDSEQYVGNIEGKDYIEEGIASGPAMGL